MRAFRSIQPLPFAKERDSLVREFGMPAEEVSAMLRQAGENERAQRDAVWGLFNLAATRVRDQRLPYLYSTMARFVHDEDKDPKYLLELSRHTLIRNIATEMQERGDDFSEVHLRILNTRGCEACAVPRPAITLAEALRTPPVPHPGCTNTQARKFAFCRCTVVRSV